MSEEDKKNVSALEEKFRQVIADKFAKGFTPREIAEIIKTRYERPITAATVQEFLDSEEGEKKVEVTQSIKQKQQEVQKEDLIEDLVRIKNHLWRRVDHLTKEDLDTISNETVSELIKAIEKLGEFIGELDRKTEVHGDNIVKIDESETYIENNIKKVVKHLPDDEKEEIVEDLTDELGLIIKKDPEEYEEDQDILDDLSEGEEDEEEEGEDEDEEEKEKQEVNA